MRQPTRLSVFAETMVRSVLGEVGRLGLAIPGEREREGRIEYGASRMRGRG